MENGEGGGCVFKSWEPIDVAPGVQSVGQVVVIFTTTTKHWISGIHEKCLLLWIQKSRKIQGRKKRENVCFLDGDVVVSIISRESAEGSCYLGWNH